MILSSALASYHALNRRCRLYINCTPVTRRHFDLLTLSTVVTSGSYLLYIACILHLPQCGSSVSILCTWREKYMMVSKISGKCEKNWKGFQIGYSFHWKDKQNIWWHSPYQERQTFKINLGFKKKYLLDTVLLSKLNGALESIFFQIFEALKMQ